MCFSDQDTHTEGRSREDTRRKQPSVPSISLANVLSDTPEKVLLSFRMNQGGTPASPSCISSLVGVAMELSYQLSPVPDFEFTKARTLEASTCNVLRIMPASGKHDFTV